MYTTREHEYRPVGNNNAAPRKEESAEPKIRKTRSFKSKLCFCMSSFAGIVWLLPIIFLLVWNVQNHIIGGSAWCPGNFCGAISILGWGNATAFIIQTQDQNNRNLLGALQYVSKALEVWFVFVAGSLVYMIEELLARGESGLPIGHLMTFLEFTDLRVLFSPSLWAAPIGPRIRHPDRAIKFWLFTILAVFLCALANLMGPSTAALLLPTLQWVPNTVDTPAKFWSIPRSRFPQKQHHPQLQGKRFGRERVPLHI